jgi:ankyrin repeat protein
MYFKFLVYLFTILFTINNATAFSDSEIHEAIKDENTSLFIEMMAAGIDVDEKDAKGNTPLMKASAMGKIKFVKFLIDMGANVDKRNNTGQCALHSAAKEGYNDIIEILLDNGAFVNLPDLDGYTPLMYAIISEKKNTVELLVNREASIEFINIHGLTALDIAKKKRFGHIVKLLEEAKYKKEDKPNYSWDY